MYIFFFSFSTLTQGLLFMEYIVQWLWQKQKLPVLIWICYDCSTMDKHFEIMYDDHNRVEVMSIHCSPYSAAGNQFSHVTHIMPFLHRTFWLLMQGYKDFQRRLVKIFLPKVSLIIEVWFNGPSISVLLIQIQVVGSLSRDTQTFLGHLLKLIQKTR